MEININYTIQRENADEIEEISLEVTGDFYHGELEDYSVVPNVKLTEKEDEQIVEKLCDAFHDDWDEDAYKTRRTYGG